MFLFCFVATSNSAGANITLQMVFPLVQILVSVDTFSRNGSAEWKGMCLLTLVAITRFSYKGMAPFYTPTAA